MCCVLDVNLAQTLWNFTLCTAEKLKGLLSFYRSLRDEYDYWLSADLVEGTIPAELQGTLFRCAGLKGILELHPMRAVAGTRVLRLPSARYEPLVARRRQSLSLAGLVLWCRNGPGQLEIFGARIDQPFDGDGMICRFTFADGKAHFSNRYMLCTHERGSSDGPKTYTACRRAHVKYSDATQKSDEWFLVQICADTGLH